ncbi:MAG TPA: glycogen debranching protein GlgX [Gammaproteobacteria bacterium]|nr:glycogen debranching protein GlgX [Gammaproteobacteria bacterium]
MIEPGSPDPLGARVLDGGTNFAVYADGASRVELCLLDAAGQETRRYDLPAETGGTWHGFVPGIAAGQRYGFRAHGPYEPEAGLRFNPSKLLVDPYARALSGQLVWCDALFDYDPEASRERLVPSKEDSARFVPKAVVTAPPAARATRCRVPWSDTLIYELNVRGLTMRHPAVGIADRGRFGALASRPLLEHFRALGITSVELLPIQAFVDENLLRLKGLRNFWGYNTLAYFAPEPRYLGRDGAAGLKRVIDRLHGANIEVLLDVVYNHTAEGGRLGPTLSFRGLANASYYRLVDGNLGEYVNDTGCGNTIDGDEPIVRRLIVDNLSYWVTEFGIDGFRFDLASVLGRTREGFVARHPLFAEIRDAPALKDVKLIAEPWDLGPGGYRLGGFPLQWAEWNDQYRDTVRRFWCREPGQAPSLARRVHGSSDIFEPSGRGPAASINFVASHDGFTTADLVTYAERHNEANGEDNCDGHRHNFSENHGIEGATDNPVVLAVRRRHRLNLLATLLFSQGTPMLLAGDELGNSQSGNNNAYAQDNEIGWLDWSALTADPGFFAEVCELARVRRELALLRQSEYRHGEPSAATGRPNFEWFDAESGTIAEAEWPWITALGALVSLPDEMTKAEDRVLAVALLFNASETDYEFSLPPIAGRGEWVCRYSSAGGRPKAISGNRFRVAGFSLACLGYQSLT